MALFIFAVLIGIPFLEIAVFIKVSSGLGLGLTLSLTILTAIAGTVMLRIQGLSTMIKVRESLNNSEMPLRAAFDGACQLLAGVFLLTPGFITDFAGLLLFFPPIRGLLLAWIVRRLNISTILSDRRQTEHGVAQEYDIEGSYKDVTPEEPEKPEQTKKHGGD